MDVDKIKRSKMRKKRYVVPVILLLLLIALRIALPYIVKKYVNDTLADIPGYYGQVEDIDLSLIRGAYVIKNLYLNKVNAGSEVPFLDFEKTDISIEWKSLFRGKIVSEIIMTRPKVIYVFEDQQKDTVRDADGEDWSKALTDLVPIDINTLTVNGGKVAFVQLTADPTVDLHLDQLSLTATNLRNVVSKDMDLPSELHAKAVSIGNGNMVLDGRMNLVQRIPDMDMSLSLENSHAPALNAFTSHYAGIDFDEGDFSLYSEVVIADGFLKGYIKPILKDAKLIGKGDKFLDVLWEGFVGFFKFILKNHRNNTLATKVPLEGDLNAVQSKLWPTITNIFKNAWIQAFKGVVDGEIDYEQVKKEAQTNN
tara:strand:+ start:43580 stop:44680 length:1101 start_codon:yes stop_codon:yes gene_type:complete